MTESEREALQDGFDTWSDDALVDYSAALYERYLEGEDTLAELHEIAEELRSRDKAKAG